MRVGGGCPTCGAPPFCEYQVIPQASLSTSALLVVGIALFLVSAAGKPVGNWEAGALLALSLCILVTWGVIRTHRRRAVLWEGGFVLLGRRDPPEAFRWADITDIQWSAEGDALRCVDGEGQPVATIEMRFFGTQSRAERFLNEAPLWRKRT